MKNNASDISGLAYKPGEHIGKYEVREVLGIGGQSIVYKCHDPLLGRFVAIKQIATHLAHDQKYLDQLNRSIQNLARLGSMNEAIVTIHEMIRDENGLFYVMEFLAGHTLETIISQTPGPVEPKAVLLILFRLTAALHDVHGEGIVHRDMKPSNIIVCDGLRPKIIDFGVASVPGGEVSMPLATTKYLAPEIYGPGKVDGRADLYSLGFIAYEMLLGRAKFNEIFADIISDPQAEALRWMKWHGNASVTAPLPREVNPAIPEALSTLIAKMLAKDPAGRFTDTEELGRAIKSHFSGRVRVSLPQAQEPGEEALAELTGQRGIGTIEGGEIEIHAASEIELPEEPGPPTAPLPREPMSRKTKFALGAIAAVVLLLAVGVGVKFVIDSRARGRTRMISAEAIYDQARANYDNEEFAAALAGYQQLVKTVPQSLAGRKAKLFAALCQINLAIENHQWDEAQLRENEADELAQTMQDDSDSDELTQWIRQRQEDIEELGRYRLSSAVFFGAVQRCDESLGRALRADDFDAALGELEKTLATSDVNLSEKQEQLLARQKDKIARAKFLFVLASLRSRAEKLHKVQKFDQARELIAQAQAMLAGGSDALKLFPAEQRQSLGAALEAQSAKLEAGAKLARAIAAVDQASQSNDLPKMRHALQYVLKQPGLSATQRKAYQGRLAQVLSAIELLSARKLLRAGDTAGARLALQRVLKTSPKNSQAQAMLKNIDTAARKEKLIQAANLDFVSRRFNKALANYEAAARLGAEERIRLRIVDCRFNLLMGQAEALGQAGKYDAAAQAYNQARQIKPANATQIDAMLLLLENQRQYDMYIRMGDRAREEKKWTQALQAYENARQTQATEEVDQRVKLTKYTKNLALGDEAMREGNYSLARFYFKLARKQNDTKEVQARLNTILENE